MRGNPSVDHAVEDCHLVCPLARIRRAGRDGDRQIHVDILAVVVVDLLSGRHEQR